jgi:hypothetical protein
MIMNKLMKPYWEEVQGWELLSLPAGLESYLEDQVPKLNQSAEEKHIHVRDYGVRDKYLGYGLLFVKGLFNRFSAVEHNNPLLAYVSLDDGSLLTNGNIIDGVPWFDCTVHFHIKWNSGLQWTDPATIEECAQPCLILDSNDADF